MEWRWLETIHMLLMVINGLLIFDVTNPANPALEGFLYTGGYSVEWQLRETLHMLLMVIMVF